MYTASMSTLVEEIQELEAERARLGARIKELKSQLKAEKKVARVRPQLTGERLRRAIRRKGSKAIIRELLEKYGEEKTLEIFATTGVRWPPGLMWESRPDR